MTQDEMKAQDLMFIKEGNWPLRTALPIKRYPRKENLDTGLLVKGLGPVVFLLHLFSLADGSQNLNDCGKLKYESYEALLDDGWMVD